MNRSSPNTEQAWHELHADLLGFIRRRVADQGQSDDLLQETFLRIHDRIETLDDVERLRAWVYTIARNVVTDHFRTRAKLPTSDASFDPVAEESADENLNAEVAGWLREMVDHLPEKYREAVTLSELDGLRQKQVAEQLGLSLSGAKSRIQRGRQMLKETLLRCCHFEFDERGNVLNFHQRTSCASCCAEDSSC